MKVDAKYYVLADNDTLKAFELHLAKEEVDELYKILKIIKTQEGSNQ